MPAGKPGTERLATPDEGADDCPQGQELSRLQRQLRLLEGDRRTYTEEAYNILIKQEFEIKNLEQENRETNIVLALAMSEQNASKDEENTYTLEDLVAQLDAFNLQAEGERKKMIRLDLEFKRTHKEINYQRKLKGGHTGCSLEKMMQKQTKVMENRHNKAMVQFNNQLALNACLREEIDHLREEKAMFDTLYKKLNNELEEKRKDMSLVIEEASQAYEERDEAYNKMVALRERSEKDSAQYELELKELQRIIEHDNRLKEFMMIKSNDRADYKEEEEAKRKKAMKGDRDGDTENKQIQSYEEAFAEIKEATGEEDIVKIMTDFLRREDENFALFNYVNELNDEVEKLQEEIGVMKSEINRFEEEDVQMEAHRKVWLKELEDKSVTAGRLADTADKKITELSQTLGELSDGIESLFRCLACDRTPINEMLGSDDGVTEKNILLYMGIIEQRTMELLHVHHYIEMKKMAPVSEKEKAKDAKGKEPDQTATRKAPAAPIVAIPTPGLGEEDDYYDISDEIDLRPLSHEELKTMAMKRITRSGLMSTPKTTTSKDDKLKSPKLSRGETRAKQ